MCWIRKYHINYIILLWCMYCMLAYHYWTNKLPRACFKGFYFLLPHGYKWLYNHWRNSHWHLDENVHFIKGLIEKLNSLLYLYGGILLNRLKWQCLFVVISDPIHSLYSSIQSCFSYHKRVHFFKNVNISCVRYIQCFSDLICDC